MPKKLLFIWIILLLFAACNKHNDDLPAQPQTVVFSGKDASSVKAKAAMAECNNPPADYAVIVIEGNTYRPKVFYIGGTPFTEAIKLLPGTYLVDEFLLMHDANSPGFLDDDIIVQAIPAAGSDYAQFVRRPVSFEIVVSHFDKTEVSVEVICFNETDFSKFGFDWFAMSEVTVMSQKFYGTLCTEHPNDYQGSPYAGQSDGLQSQMPAIFRIDVYRNGAYLLSYNNESWLGETDAVEVLYPDHNNAADHFDFELYTLVKSCDGFYYRHMHTWSSSDDGLLNTGDDDIVDFVIGTSATGDYQLSSYYTLPEQALLDVSLYGVATGHGTFADLQLQNIPDGYLVSNGIYGGWNAEHTKVDYDLIYDDPVIVNVYSSLCIDLLPEVVSPEKKNWEAANWLMNHLDRYNGYAWDDVQAALWLILDKYPSWDGNALAGVRALSELPFAQQMHDEAIDESAGFVAGPGEVYAIIFVNSDFVERSEKADVHVQFVSYGN